MPGVKPENVEITLEGDTLTIKGEHKAEEEKEDVHYHLRERRYGTFSRTITLPTTVKAEDIQADYHDGILELKMPKSEFRIHFLLILCVLGDDRFH